MLGGLGGAPERTKSGVFSRTLPGGVRRRVYGLKVVRWVENCSPKGLQNGAKSVKKGVPITHRHSCGTPWVPIGDPGVIFGGSGVDFR